MAYRKHNLLQFGGSIVAGGGAIEQWSSGIRVVMQTDQGVDIDTTVDQQNSYLSDVAYDALVAYFNANPYTSNAVRLEWIKFNAIDPAGHYVHDTTSEITVPEGEASGFGGAIKYPLQISVVTTFETEARRGFGSRGRMYVAGPTIGLSSTTAQFDQSSCQGLADRTATLIEALDNTSLFSNRHFVPAIVSKSGGTDGTWRPITAVSVDTVPDTQRRRANELVGTRLRTVVDA